MELIKFNIDKPTPEKIWDVYDHYKRSLDYYFDPSQNVDFKEEFAGLSNEEIDEQKRSLLDELSLRSSFYLLTYIETLFRTDFILRIESNKKGYTDILTKEYKKIYKPTDRLYSYSLKDVIFKNWKRYINGKQYSKEMRDILNTLPQYFDFRNWIAHGRYWVFKEPNYKQKYNYDQIRIVLSQIETYFGPLLKKKNFGLN